MRQRWAMISVAALIVGGLIVFGTHQIQRSAYGAPPSEEPVVTVNDDGAVAIKVRDDEDDEDSDVALPFGVTLNLQDEAETLKDQIRDQAEALKEQAEAQAEALKEQAEAWKDMKGNINVPGMNFHFDNQGFRSAYSKSRRKVQKLQREMREADEKKKPELTKQLATAVAECFDEDMKVREKELTRIEERLNKLRTRLDLRRKKRDEIIQLELKVLTNEAEGLGFSGLSEGGHHMFGLMDEGFDRDAMARKVKNKAKRHIVIRHGAKAETPAAPTAPPGVQSPPTAPAAPAAPPVKATSL